MSATTWSAQQETIFSWFAEPQEGDRRHAIVRARAGCGKTTVIIEGVRRAPEQDILICAFSKDIETELKKRIGTGHANNITARTLHALGLSCITKFRSRMKVDFGSDRADALARQVCGKMAPDAIIRLVSKLHTKGRLMAPHAMAYGDLSVIAIKFECEPDDSWAACMQCGRGRESVNHGAGGHEYRGFDARYVEERALEAMELASQIESGGSIDGSDMIFLPVRNRWLSKQFDLVVVDEAQDMTAAQLEIALGVLRPGGRMMVVGDDRQAIFSFIGADSDSLDRLKNELNADEMGLTTTYRCGRIIVERAATIVPDFEAGPSNPEGLISFINTTELTAAAGPGDFILSRVNAPLVSHAMQLLRAGKRCQVAGRDIGKGLRGMVKRLNARSVPDLLAKIEGWKNRECARIKAQSDAVTNGRKAALEAKRDAIIDQADMLASLCDGARNVAEVDARIEALFTDDGLGAAGRITCSSVHKAKGLEANRVFILRDTLRSNTREEENITYVAITRAKSELIWVADDIKKN